MEINEIEDKYDIKTKAELVLQEIENNIGDKDERLNFHKVVTKLGLDKNDESLALLYVHTYIKTMYKDFPESIEGLTLAIDGLGNDFSSIIQDIGTNFSTGIHSVVAKEFELFDKEIKKFESAVNQLATSTEKAIKASALEAEQAIEARHQESVARLEEEVKKIQKRTAEAFLMKVKEELDKVKDPIFNWKKIGVQFGTTVVALLVFSFIHKIF